MSQYLSLDGMIEAASQYDALKTDYTDDAPPQFMPDMSICFQTSDGLVGNYRANTHALAQLCARIGQGTFGKGMNRALPREIIKRWADDPDYQPHLAQILNAHVRRVRNYGSTWFTRCYDNTVRAFLSERYAPLSNLEMLERLREALYLLGNPAIELVRPYLTSDQLDLKITLAGEDILPTGEAPYRLGCYVSNDEVGRRRIKIYPLIQRTLCTNSIILSSDADATLDVTHRGQHALLSGHMALIIGKALKMSAERLRAFLSLKQIVFLDIFEQISRIAAAEHWSVEFSDAVRAGLEGGNSLYAYINGLTAAAHHVYAEQPEEMLNWEMRAGRIVTEPASAGLDFNRAIVSAP